MTSIGDLERLFDWTIDAHRLSIISLSLYEYIISMWLLFNCLIFNAVVKCSLSYDIAEK